MGNEVFLLLCNIEPCQGLLTKHWEKGSDVYSLKLNIFILLLFTLAEIVW